MPIRRVAAAVLPPFVVPAPGVPGGADDRLVEVVDSRGLDALAGRIALLAGEFPGRQ